VGGGGGGAGGGGGGGGHGVDGGAGGAGGGGGGPTATDCIIGPRSVKSFVSDSNFRFLEKIETAHMFPFAGNETLTDTFSVLSSIGLGETVTVALVAPMTARMLFARLIPS